MKAYRSEKGGVNIFRPQANLARMTWRGTHVHAADPEELVLDGLRELVDLDGTGSPRRRGFLYIRPFMFATDEYIGVRPSDTYRFIIFTCPVQAYYKEAVRVKIETYYSRAFPGGTGRPECGGNYAAPSIRPSWPSRMASINWYGRMVWNIATSRNPGTMNVFFRIGDTLVTPETGGTILEGIITGQHHRPCARREGIATEVRKVEVREVLDAIAGGTLKEAFGAGTAATIAHMSSIAYDGGEYQLPAPEQFAFANRLAPTAR